MSKHFGSLMAFGLTVVASVALHGCSSGGGSSRTQQVGSSDGVSSAGFIKVGTTYRQGARKLTDGGLSLAGATVVRYTAAVSGGVACFGDLYESGTSKNVSIDVAAGEKLMVRKDAKDCKVTYTSLTFDDNTVTSDKGLNYFQDDTATFKSTDRTYVQVTVLKGLSGDTMSENLQVELQGVFIDAEDAETRIENAELFVSTSGTAYAAPAVSFDNQNVQYFNGRIYGTILCSVNEAADGCKDNKDGDQKLSDMEVWVTNDNLEAIAPADRFTTLEDKFSTDGTVVMSADPVLTGRQLASSDGSLGVTPGTFNIEEKNAYLVIRLKHAQVNTYKVFLLNK